MPLQSRRAITTHGLRVYRGDLTIADKGCDGALTMPLRDSTGEVHSLQFITASGDKLFLPGGAKSGHYFAIGKATAARLVIAEGYATGASIHEATGDAVAIAIDAGNLEPVTRALREKFPEAEIIIAADDDARTICGEHKRLGLTLAEPISADRPARCKCNPGLMHAIAAARAVGAHVALPLFTQQQRESGDPDFNDLARLRGVDAVVESMQDNRLASVSSVSTEDDWPKPQALPHGLLPVEPFEFALLPEKLRPWAEDICERVQCPPDYVGVTIMAALGSLIGRQIGIRPQEHTDWTEVPNQWALCVGRPGVLKSPAMQAALAPLHKLAAEAREKHCGEKAEHDRLLRMVEIAAKVAQRKAEKDFADALKKNPLAKPSFNESIGNIPDDSPVLRRYEANNTSVESLGEILARTRMVCSCSATKWCRCSKTSSGRKRQPTAASISADGTGRTLTPSIASGEGSICTFQPCVYRCSAPPSPRASRNTLEPRLRAGPPMTA